MERDLKDVAEMILFGLQENDKVKFAAILDEASDAEKVELAIETDTGQQFFAEVIQA